MGRLCTGHDNRFMDTWLSGRFAGVDAFTEQFLKSALFWISHYNITDSYGTALVPQVHRCADSQVVTSDVFALALDLLAYLSPLLWDGRNLAEVRSTPEMVAAITEFHRRVQDLPVIVRCRRNADSSATETEPYGDVCRDLLATHLRYCLRRVVANDAPEATFMRMYTLRELAYSIVFLRMTTNTHLRSYGMSEVLSGYINGGLINMAMYNTLGFYVNDTHGFPDLEIASPHRAAQIAKRLLVPRTFLLCLGSSLDPDIRQALSLPGIPADAAINRKETR
jgi:hypothetical protein